MGPGLKSACFITKFVVAFGAMSLTLATAAPCADLDGSVHVNGKCLKFFDIAMTWFEAQDFCSTNLYGGTLAEPLTPEERNTTVNLALSLQQTFWLGAAYVTAAGTFKFTRSLASLPANDSWWATGAPGPGAVEHCLHVGDNLLTVVDRSCATLERPLCQIEVTPKEPPIDPCAPWKGATYRNGKCLKTFNISRSWQEAQKFCPAAMPGAKLVEFFTEQERWNIMSYGSDGGFQKIWVGGADVSHNRTFVWSTNQNVAIERNVWNNFEPNDAWLGEDCLCQLAANGRFNDAPCGDGMPSLCETALSNACDVTTSLSFNQKCITLNIFDQTWDKAQELCQTAGGTLAEPTDSAERIAIMNKFPDKFYWVGATDTAVEGSFVWTNHQTVVRLNWWQDGQPEDGLSEFCVAFDSRVGTLSDEDCANALPFICQFDAANPCEVILPGSVYASGYCFKYYSQQMTWPEARSYCLHNNSHLAEPKTAEMQRVVQLHLGPLNAAWLGASNAITRENFTWVTGGEQVVSTYLSPSGASGLDDYLLWNNTAGGVLWQDRAGTEKHGFLCQTAVVVVDPQRHVAVLPKMVRNGSPEAHLQITASFRYVEVYLTFKVSYDKGVEEEKLMTLTPKRAVQFNLNSSLTVSDTDVYSRFVEVTSSMPVVVVLYVMDRTLSLASSCLIFPAQMFAGKQAGRSYILHSGIPYRKDTTVAIVAMSGGTTDVMITYNNHGAPDSSFGIGGVAVNKLYSVRATLKYLNDAMTVSIGANLDGAYVNASQPVAVFLENVGNKSGTPVYDFSMDQLLPLEYIEEEYIGFFQPLTSPTKDYYKFVAVHDWTFVEIRYLNQSTKSTVLKAVGDATVLDAPPNSFYQIRGNASFYVYQIFDRGRSGCMSALLPASAWRYQYDFEINSAYMGYTVKLLVIVWSNMSSYFEINYNDIPKYSYELKGTPYTGLYYSVPSTDRYYHLQVTNQRAKFGAYIFAYSTSSSFCHPLGIAAKQGTASSIPSYDKYQASLLQEDVPQTTCGFEGTTLETAYEATEITSDPAVSTSGPITDTPYFATSDAHATKDDATYADTTQGEKQHSDVTIASSSLKTTTWSTTGQNIVKLTDDIIRHLYIDNQNTSAYRRSMTSAPDYRFSARMIGGVGVAVLVSVFTIISLGDSSHMYKLYKFLGGKGAVS